MAFHNISATGVAGAQVQASLPAVSNSLTWVAGFTVTTAPPISGTSPLTALVTLTDGTWTLNFILTETLSAGGWMSKEFDIPLFASGLNTAITLTLPAVSNGGIGAVELHGYSIP